VLDALPGQDCFGLPRGEIPTRVEDADAIACVDALALAMVDAAAGF
jgi:class 3 adenylate cyclase